MVLPILLVLAQAAPTAATPQRDIIVVARRAEKQLADCLARNCPPAEEIEASLQASVEQFADGRYTDARQTLRRAISRNKGVAAILPGPVSSLYATLATVAEHDGDESLWLTSARNNVLVLRKHLGEGNASTLQQELSFGDSLVGLDSLGSARATYAKVQRLALETGQRRMAAAAAFRRAWVALLTRRDSEAQALADEAVDLAGPDDRTMPQLRDIVRMRIALRRGDEGAVDALAAQLRRSATEQPLVLTVPPLTDLNVVRLQPWSEPVRFADIGYWIRPDGRTAGVEVLRDSGLGQWSHEVLRQVEGRRYMPLAVAAGDPGLYRIDRYTVRAPLGSVTGTRIQQRTGRLTIHVVDLTETDAMSAAQRDRMINAGSGSES